MTGLYAGLRREEILGLQWDCVFLDNETPYLSVRRAWYSEHNRSVIKSFSIQSLKKPGLSVLQEIIYQENPGISKDGALFLAGGIKNPPEKHRFQGECIWFFVPVSQAKMIISPTIMPTIVPVAGSFDRHMRIASGSSSPNTT